MKGDYNSLARSLHEAELAEPDVYLSVKQLTTRCNLLVMASGNGSPQEEGRWRQAWRENKHQKIEITQTTATATHNTLPTVIKLLPSNLQLDL